MSRIDDLIQELCPDGVPSRKIGDISHVGTGSSDRQDASDVGAYPFYVRSKDVLRIDSYEFDETAILIPGEGGIGEIFHFVTGKYALHQRAYRISSLDPDVDTRFAYYYFSTHFKKFILQKAVGATVTSIRKPMITDFCLPVPPLEIQREVVAILDTFTELEAELEARRAQYQVYRAELFRFGQGQAVTWAALRDFCEFRRGTAITARVARSGAIPVVANGPSSTYFHDASNRDGGTVVVARSGAYAGLVSFWDGPIFLTDAFSIHPRTAVATSRYVFHLLQSQQGEMHSLKRGAGVPHVRVREIQDRIVALPPLDEQARIVEALDALGALINDVSIGLPAELAARRKQYEYYRDKLLTFPEAS